MDNLSLYKDHINSLVLDSKLNDFIKSGLNQVTEKLSNTLPVRLDSTNLQSGTWIEKLVSEKIILPENEGNALIKLLKLHDGTFVAINSDAATIHYTANFNAIRRIPFDYDTPTVGDPSFYETPYDATVIEYSILESNVSTPASLLLISQSDQHIVQGYRYYNDEWTHLGAIGTIDDPDFADDLLDTPAAVSGYFDKDDGTMRIVISNFGIGPSASDTFVKSFIVTPGSSLTVNSSEVISYPGIFTTITLSKGSMLYSELKDSTHLLLTKEDLLYAADPGLTEFGALDIVEDPKTVFVTKGNLKELDFNDVFAHPNTFDVSGSKIVVGDTKGHIALLDTEGKVLKTFGGFVDDAETTEYPNKFSEINNLLIVGNDLYIVSNAILYRTNFLSIAEQSLIYKVDATGYDYEVKDVIGLVDGGEVTLSIDSETYYSLLEFISSKTVGGSDDLYVKVKVTQDQLINGEFSKKNGVVIIAF